MSVKVDLLRARRALQVLTAVVVASSSGCRCRDIPTAKPADDASQKQVQVERWSADRFEIVSVGLDDGQVKVLYQRGRGAVSGFLPFEAAISSDGALIAVKETDGPIEIVRLATGAKVELAGTRDCIEPLFLRGRPWLMCTREHETVETYQIMVFDFENQTVITTLKGAAPRQAATDESVFFNRAEEIFSYLPSTNLARRVKDVNLEEEDLGVVEVVPVSAQKFFYLRGRNGSSLYADEADTVLLPWDQTRYPDHNWQGELRVDATGDRVVFSEGDDSKALVVVDLVTRHVQRFATPRVFPHLVAIDQARVAYLSEGPDESRLFVHSVTTDETRELLRFSGLMRAPR